MRVSFGFYSYINQKLARRGRRGEEGGSGEKGEGRKWADRRRKGGRGRERTGGREGEHDLKRTDEAALRVPKRGLAIVAL